MKKANEARAISKFVRISPKKAHLAAGLIRGLKAEEALHQLKYSSLKSGALLMKTLQSAMANAETQLDAKRADLKIKEVRIEEGSRMKRAKSKSRGSQAPILKRTAHFTIVLSV
jgi:large subunit ribosomal protein L22